MKKISIIAAVLMLFSIMSISFSACSNPLGDDELIAIFTEAYGKAEMLNEYVWGDGLAPAEYDTSVTLEPYYVAVAENAEYKTKEALLAAISEVYVEDFVSGEITEMLFEGYGEGGPDPRYSVADGALTVNVKYEGFDLVGRFLPETAEVKRSTATTVVFKVNYERDGKFREESVMMRLEGDTWKFEAPMY